MRINTNLTAMNTFTQYTKNNNNIAKAVEKLSSGYAINSAADNAAGLAISEKMRAQIRGLEQAATNSQDAISLVQTAEGGLNETTEVLQRMRELAVQSANDTNENEIDREALQDEFDQLQMEIDSIAKSTSFNKKTVLDGSLAQYRARTATQDLATPGLSVNLGNVAAGAYSFEAVVKTERAAVEGQSAEFSPISTNDAITIKGNPDLPVPYLLGDTALPNGDYTIEASYNPATYELSVAAKGNNGQTFTAVLDKTALDDAGANPATLTLNFKNGNSTAFSYKIEYQGAFTTTNSSSLSTFADLLSTSTSVSASGGVDPKNAEYALYATLTGGDDVKLEAGMSSVSFTNGVTVNFDELTTADVTVGADDFAAQNNVATKASYTYDLSKSTTTGNFTGVSFDSVAVTFDTDLDTTMASFVEAYNAADKDYEASFADGKLTFTAKVAGEVGGGTDGVPAAAPALTGTLTATGPGYTAAATTDGTGTITALNSVTDGSNSTDTIDQDDIDALKLQTGVAVGGMTVDFSTITGLTAGTTTVAQFQTAIATHIANTAKTYNADKAALNATYTSYSENVADYTIAFQTDKTATITAANTETQTYSATTSTTITAADAVEVEGADADPDAPEGNATYKDAFGEEPSKFEVVLDENPGMVFQIGANQGDELKIYIEEMSTEYLGVASASILSRTTASKALTTVDAALNQVASQRAYLGAMQNRLEHKIANLETSAQNLTDAESTIRDVDMAKQMTEFTNANILSQAATSMLAQANSLPQNVLSLLQG